VGRTGRARRPNRRGLAPLKLTPSGPRPADGEVDAGAVVRVDSSSRLLTPGGIVNLLVTNSRHSQAYTIIRALRPYARKIVATMYGENRLVARLSPAANLRHVYRRYYVPSPAADWRAGRVGREGTEREEAYVQTLLAICESEEIDTIFPSWDPKVHVSAK
jgi:hypothetical protein